MLSLGLGLRLSLEIRLEHVIQRINIKAISDRCNNALFKKSCLKLLRLIYCELNNINNVTKTCLVANGGHEFNYTYTALIHSGFKKETKSGQAVAVG